MAYANATKVSDSKFQKELNKILQSIEKAKKNGRRTHTQFNYEFDKSIIKILEEKGYIVSINVPVYHNLSTVVYWNIP